MIVQARVGLDGFSDRDVNSSVVFLQEDLMRMGASIPERSHFIPVQEGLLLHIIIEDEKKDGVINYLRTSPYGFEVSIESML